MLEPSSADTNPKNSKLSLIICAVAVIFSFGAGWLVHSRIIDSTKNSQTLRSGGEGYKFINPLLLCNVNEKNQSEESGGLGKKLQSFVDQAISKKDIDNASIYFRELGTGKWSDINGNEVYSLASLGKLPILITYLKLGEADSKVFEKILIYNGDQDDNKQQEIVPINSIIPNKPYQVSELLFYMMAYSDNNATALLYNNLDFNYLKAVYEDLGISLENVGKNPKAIDFITARQYSYFFRILFNATFLNRGNSEQALKAMTQTTFKDGLRMGVPENIEVAHKFGLTSILDQNVLKITSRELHDCGIIYTENPYLLCVMTKSHAPIEKIEGFIKDVSKTVYEEVIGKN